MNHEASGRRSKLVIAGLCCAGIIVVAVVIFMACRKACRTAEKIADMPGETAKAVGEEAQKVIDALDRIGSDFKTGTVKTEFLSYHTKVRGTLRLQIASVSQIEEFYYKDSASYFWKLLPLPDVEFDWRIPVTYTFYVDLEETWDISLDEKNEVVTIVAPPIKANEPAPDISKWEKRDTSSLWRIGEKEIADKLQGGMTAELRKRASTIIKDSSVRELARKKIGEFFRTWWVEVFLKSRGITDDKIVGRYKIAVQFADEAGQGAE